MIETKLFQEVRGAELVNHRDTVFKFVNAEKCQVSIRDISPNIAFCNQSHSGVSWVVSGL